MYYLGIRHRFYGSYKKCKILSQWMKGGPHFLCHCPNVTGTGPKFKKSQIVFKFTFAKSCRQLKGEYSNKFSVEDLICVSYFWQSWCNTSQSSITFRNYWLIRWRILRCRRVSSLTHKMLRDSAQASNYCLHGTPDMQPSFLKSFRMSFSINLCQYVSSKIYFH